MERDTRRGSLVPQRESAARCRTGPQLEVAGVTFSGWTAKSASQAEGCAESVPNHGTRVPTRSSSVTRTSESRCGPETSVVPGPESRHADSWQRTPTTGSGKASAHGSSSRLAWVGSSDAGDSSVRRSEGVRAWRCCMRCVGMSGDEDLLPRWPSRRCSGLAGWLPRGRWFHADDECPVAAGLGEGGLAVRTGARPRQLPTLVWPALSDHERWLGLPARGRPERIPGAHRWSSHRRAPFTRNRALRPAALLLAQGRHKRIWLPRRDPPERASHEVRPAPASSYSSRRRSQNGAASWPSSRPTGVRSSRK